MGTQLGLFDDAATCVDRHGPIIDGDPIDYGDCVNVEWICSVCGEILGEVSWSKEAWRERATAPDRHRARVRGVRRLRAPINWGGKQWRLSHGPKSKPKPWRDP